MIDRKALTRRYKEAPPPAGIFAVRNNADDRVLLGAALNVAGRLNRERFSLETGSNLSKPLQADWDRLGENAFTFEVLDTLDPADTDTDVAEDLAELLSMWLERLSLPAEKLYAPR